MSESIEPLAVDIHIDELANFVFVKNAPGQNFTLSLEGIETTKDLFFFVLDLFCKGLVAMYGQDGASVDLTTIDAAKFEAVAVRLACAGIKVHLVRMPLLDDDLNLSPQINMPQLVAMPENAPLDSFVFKLRMSDTQYELSFKLMRTAGARS